MTNPSSGQNEQAQHWTVHRPLRDINIAIGIAVFSEIAIAGLMSLAVLPFLAAMTLHVAITLFLGTYIFMRSGKLSFADISARAFAWLLIAVSGPAGALAILLAAPFRPAVNLRPDLLQSWYDRLSGASGIEASTYLQEQVAAGRAVRFDAEAPPDFSSRLTGGTLAERQAVLGLIARKFHPDYAPALLLALRSEEPVVRVQAAAVVARVRADLKAKVKQQLEKVEVETSGLTIDDASLLTELADCQLVDRADAQLCQDAAEQLLGRLLSAGHSARQNKIPPVDEARQLTAERFLMSKNRFKDFRVLRRIQAIEARSRFKIRFLRAERSAQ